MRRKPTCSPFVSEPLHILHFPCTLSGAFSAHSVLNNKLGDGADALVAAAHEMSQLITLCGIQPEQEDIDFYDRGLDAGDAKLLAFDLSKNQAIKRLK